jgi:hypothetical protein
VSAVAPAPEPTAPAATKAPKSALKAPEENKPASGSDIRSRYISELTPSFRAAGLPTGMAKIRVDDVLKHAKNPEEASMAIDRLKQVPSMSAKEAVDLARKYIQSKENPASIKEGASESAYNRGVTAPETMPSGKKVRIMG